MKTNSRQPNNKGVVVKEMDRDLAKIVWVKISNERDAEDLGKPIGNYVTIEGLRETVADVNAHRKIAKILSDTLVKLGARQNDGEVLVVGLGNRQAVTDSLGSLVVAKTLVTRHMLNGLSCEQRDMMRAVSAIEPGVMGATGIETCQIVKGVVEQTKPSLVIAVDALAAKKLNHVNASIQISDVGISPGSGLGAGKTVLNQGFLGVPVIAIGVPTVVDVATIANDVLGMMWQVCDPLVEFPADEQYGLIKQLLTQSGENMFVTPKEVDKVTACFADIIAAGINAALQPLLTMRDAYRLVCESKF